MRATIYAFSHPDAVRRVPARPIARACIGQYFSMLEAALAVIVRHYELTSIAERVPLAPRITLHLAAPVACRLTPRGS